MRCWLVLALLGLIAAQSTPAQPVAAGTPAPEAHAPPSRVGAVTVVAGDLAFHAPGASQWAAAGVNYPFVTGSSYWTDPQARAQIQIGPTTLTTSSGRFASSNGTTAW